MAWTAPRTWVVGEILTSALLNTHVRDNLNFLKGNAGSIILGDNIQLTSGYGLLVNGSTVVSISTASFQHIINRQASTNGSTDWTVATSGAQSNYLATNAFIQTGVVLVSCTSGGYPQYNTQITFPIQYTQRPLVFASANAQGAVVGLASLPITNLMTLYLQPNTTVGFDGSYSNVTISWLAIGK